MTMMVPTAATFSERPLSFVSEGQQLSAIVHPGRGGARLGVLVIVGGPQYRVGSHRQFVHLARSLAASGVPVMRFDVAGMGDSDGPKQAFDRVSRDIAAAIDSFIAHSPGLEGVVLWGLCDGASAALIYAPSDSRVQGLVLLNPWLENDGAKAKTRLFDYYLQRLSSGAFWSKLWRGELDVRKSSREFGSTLKTATHSGPAASPNGPAAQPNDAAHYAYQQRMLESFSALQVPLCWVLSGNDLTAKEFERQYFGAKSWQKAARKKAISVERLAVADHTFSSLTWKEWLAQTTLAFVCTLQQEAMQRAVT